MEVELPDLDELVSFAVDNGAQAGPFSMRSIIASVRDRHRSPSTLIWWVGQSEWQPFESIPALMALIDPAAVESSDRDEAGQVFELGPSDGDPTDGAASGVRPVAEADSGSEVTEATSLAAVSERIESLRPVDSLLTVDDASTAQDVDEDQIYATMVERTAGRDRRGWTNRLDLDLRRAMTGVTLQQGHVLVDLRSTGVSHLMVFEEPDGSRITVGIEHLPPSSTASVSIGWGHPVAEVSAAPWPAPDAADIDTYVAAGYAYTVVDLIWEYDDYATAEEGVDGPLMVRSIEAAVHALRTQWRQRFVEGAPKGV